MTPGMCVTVYMFNIIEVHVLVHEYSERKTEQHINTRAEIQTHASCILGVMLYQLSYRGSSAG